MFVSPAIALLFQLQAGGLDIQVIEPDILRVRSVDRVTPEVSADLQRHKADLLVLIRVCDAGVQDRRDAFAKQLETAPAGILVPHLGFREAPYVKGRCHACGDLLGRESWGSCWRCMLARRLACHAPTPADLDCIRRSADLLVMTSVVALKLPREAQLRRRRANRKAALQASCSLVPALAQAYEAGGHERFDQ